jgi:ornithine cyclodeaminase
LLGIVEQAWLVKRRTAATGVVAAKKLANPKSRIATLIGAGQIGTEVARTLPHAFDLSEFRVVSRTFEGASSFADRLRPEMRCPIKAFASAEEAVADSDIVVTITLADKPVLKQGWVKKGSMICSMGGVYEIEYGVVSEIDRLVVDDLDSTLLRGDLANWIDRGDATREEVVARVDADIGQVVVGARPGRTSPDETILAVIQGMASCDLVVAKFLLEEAKKQNVGKVFDVSPQMEVPAADKLDARAKSIAGGLNRRRTRASLS